jgi:hypothetical protein
VKPEVATMNRISDTNTRIKHTPNIFENSAKINKNESPVLENDQLVNEAIDNCNKRFVNEIDQENELDPFMSNNNHIISSNKEKRVSPVESRAASVEIIVQSRLKRNLKCVLC